ncbi:hypothetical protein U9M48_017929 [Paspalum notatum var. saurae]|uniref:Methyltransferase type 11 domain-containing protein n=1 Tax=Paspalum notatum var. saurae TaxID=547442 RepID=A0AAQ3WPU3_PASNO
MATLAPRCRLLGLTGPRPTALRACAAVSFSRRAPVPPHAARPRRVFLGLGATLIDSVTRMASGGTSDRTFVAGARPRQGVSPVEQILKNVEWPDEFPFKPEDFSRFDESADTLFYSVPRFVTHIDDEAIRALTEYYSEVLPPSNTPGVAILDMCSSWVSHYPPGYKQEKIVGMGMNEDELKRNSVLTEYVVQDLNVNPYLPFEDNTFDVITNVVSADYLTKPIDVFKEMRRILKPAGLAIMSFSNRCFWTKAISIWTSTGDADHAWIVGAYFHYAGGFEPPQAADISPNPGRTDPMYVVYSKKKAGSPSNDDSRLSGASTLRRRHLSATAARPASPAPSTSPCTSAIDEPRATGRCYRDGGEALVSYAGFTIATARLPGFCVPGKGAREIHFLAAAHGVGLPEHVRDRMALEQRVGATLLDVEVKLFRSDDGSDRPTWIWCGLRMSDGTPRPPNVTPCTVLGLQNWFSVNLN